MLFYVYWLNYKHKKNIPFDYRISGYTNWVKDDLTIFYIIDNNLMSIKANGDDEKVVFTAKDSVFAYHFSPI